jgi:hypothetical protein
VLEVPTVADRLARRWPGCSWSKQSNRSSIRTPTAIGRRSPRWTPSAPVGSAVGGLTGSLTWTSPDRRTQHRHSAGDYECQATAQPRRPAAVDARASEALTDPQRGPRSPGGLLVGTQNNLVAGSRRDTAEHALRRRARCSDPYSRQRRARSDGEANVRRPLFFDQREHGDQCERSGRPAPAGRAKADGCAGSRVWYLSRCHAGARDGRVAARRHGGYVRSCVKPLDQRGPQLRTIASGEVIALPLVHRGEDQRASVTRWVPGAGSGIRPVAGWATTPPTASHREDLDAVSGAACGVFLETISPCRCACCT